MKRKKKSFFDQNISIIKKEGKKKVYSNIRIKSFVSYIVVLYGHDKRG